MTAKKVIKSIGCENDSVAAPEFSRAAPVVCPVLDEEKLHLVAAVAYFRAARYRHVGEEGCRKDDACNATSELEEILKRHQLAAKADAAP